MASSGGGERRRASRRRTLSSPGNIYEGLEDGKIKKKPRLFGRSKSCGSDLLCATINEAKPLVLSNHRRGSSLGDITNNSGYLSPSPSTPQGVGGDATFRKSPPPSEKLRRLMERFNITASLSPRNSDGGPTSFGDRPHKLTPLSQLPKTIKSDAEEADEDQENMRVQQLYRPRMTSASSVSSSSSSGALSVGFMNGDEETTRSSSFDENHPSASSPVANFSPIGGLRFDCSPFHLHKKCDEKKAVSSTKRKKLTFLESSRSLFESPHLLTPSPITRANVDDEAAPVASTAAVATPVAVHFDTEISSADPIIPEWCTNGERPSSANSTGSIKHHFAVSKSPFRPTKVAGNLFFSPCAFTSSGAPRNSVSQTPTCFTPAEGLNTSIDSACGSASRADEMKKKLTPSTAKLKIMPQRPSKRSSLRRQRSLRMGTVSSRIRTDASCANATAATTVIMDRSQRRPSKTRAVKRRSTISGTPSSTEARDMDRTARSFDNLVIYMKQAGVRMVAIDWDQTFLRCHTKSQWYGSASELQKLMRQEFCTLVRAAHRHGLYVSIVTFSEQVPLIEEVMTIAFPNIASGPRPIIVRGNCDTWTKVAASSYPWCPCEQRDRGKVPHILSAIDALPKDRLDIPKRAQNVVLIDDDVRNIEIAALCNFHAFWMDVNKPNLLWRTMMLLFVGGASDSPMKRP